MKELLNKITVGVLVRTHRAELQKSHIYTAMYFLDAGGELNTIPLTANERPLDYVPNGHCVVQHYGGMVWLYANGECAGQIAKLDPHWLGQVTL